MADLIASIGTGHPADLRDRALIAVLWALGPESGFERTEVEPDEAPRSV